MSKLYIIEDIDVDRMAVLAGVARQIVPKTGVSCRHVLGANSNKDTILLERKERHGRGEYDTFIDLQADQS